MVKYIEFDRVNTEHTVLEFRGGSEDVKVTNFTGEDIVANVVSIVSSKTEDIDNLIQSQPKEINCKEIVYSEFKALVKYSDQITNINRQVKEMIAKKYDIADEIAINKRAKNDGKRLAYESYVKNCINFGNDLKNQIGY